MHTFMSEGYKTVVAIPCSVASVVITAYLWQYPNIVFILLAFLAGIMLYIEQTVVARKIYLLGCVIGPVAEMVCLNTGVWSYAQPVVFGMFPLWLPLLWGNASLLIYRLSRWIGEEEG